jgi:hypothetical protein
MRLEMSLSNVKDDRPVDLAQTRLAHSVVRGTTSTRNLQCQYQIQSRSDNISALKPESQPHPAWKLLLTLAPVMNIPHLHQDPISVAPPPSKVPPRSIVSRLPQTVKTPSRMNWLFEVSSGKPTESTLGQICSAIHPMSLLSTAPAQTVLMELGV